MGKGDLIREMELALSEANRYAEELERVRQQQASGSVSEVNAKRQDATKKYSEAMQRYRKASRNYYEITVSQPPKTAP
jgi:hypothetical protein